MKKRIWKIYTIAGCYDCEWTTEPKIFSIIKLKKLTLQRVEDKK